MPNFVAVEFNESRLLVACAKATGRRYQINHLFELDSTDGKSAADLSEDLKQELQNRGISRCDLIGVVNRRDSEMREVSVPPAPPNELPDMVRFQARNVFASLNDNWLFDFVPFDFVPDESQKVLAMAIAPEVKSNFETLAEGAGLNLKRILFRPYSIVELFDEQLDAASNRIIVLPVDERLDFVVVAGKKVVAARTFQSNSVDDTEPEVVVNQIIGELKRTIASTKSVLNGQEIDEIIVAGQQHPVLGDFQSVLKQSLKLPVVTVNPLGVLNNKNFTADPIPESTDRFAALIGSLVNESVGKKPNVDFLDPRKPEVKKRDYRKLIIAAAGIGLLLVTAFALRWVLLSQQEAAIARKSDELKIARKQNQGDRNKEIPSVDEIISKVETLDKWYARKVNYLDEMVWLSGKMLSADDIRVSRLEGTDTPKGFVLKLNTKMTKELSTETSWKTVLGERYLPNFGGVEQTNDEKSGFDVKRNFRLERELDVDATLDRIADAMDKRIDAMDAAAEDKIPQPDTDTSEDSDQEAQ